MARKRLWTPEEMSELHRLRALGMSWGEIATKLGRSHKAIEHKIYGERIRSVAVRGKVLSEEELKWLIKHYKHTKNDKIVERLGISHSSLHRIAREHGLTKSRYFMKKVQTEAKDAAAISHRKNGTYPPKGFRIPGSDKNCFKKGQSNRDRLSPKKYAEMQVKRRVSWRKTYDRDKSRVMVWGFEARTKFRFTKQSKSKISYRYNLRKKGYIESPEDHNLYFYPMEEMRRHIMEDHAHLYGIRFAKLKN